MRDIVFEDVSPPSKSYKSSIIKRTADDTYDEMSQTNSPNLFVKNTRGMIGRGFDDIPIDTQSWPTVTTIVQPITQMVKRATLSLCDIVSVTNTSPQDDVEELPSRLIHRKSTAEAFVVYK